MQVEFEELKGDLSSTPYHSFNYLFFLRMDRYKNFTVMKKNLFITTFFAMTLVVSMASCSSSSSSDDVPSKPGTENPGGGNTPGGENPGENPGGGNAGDQEISAAQAKQSLENTAQELLGKISANDFKEFQDLKEGIAFDEDDAVSKWFEAAVDACDISTSDNEYKYLFQAANFVGEFELKNGVWKQTKKGGDHLTFIFPDVKGNLYNVTLKASAEGTEIHHKCFDVEDYYYKYDSRKEEYVRVDEKEENRFVLPKQIDVTLTRNSEVKATVSVTSSVKTGKEVDLTQDEVDVTAKATVGAYQVYVSKAAFKAGKNAEAKVVISKNDEALITVQASANGNIDNNLEGTLGKAALSVDVLGKAKVVATVDDVNMFVDNIKNADKHRTNQSLFTQDLENANKLLNAQLYLDGSSKGCAKAYLAPVEDGYGSYKEWTAEVWLQFADDSKYSYNQYFNEDKFKSVVNKVQEIVDDFVRMFQ